MSVIIYLDNQTPYKPLEYSDPVYGILSGLQLAGRFTLVLLEPTNPVGRYHNTVCVEGFDESGVYLIVQPQKGLPAIRCLLKTHEVAYSPEDLHKLLNTPCQNRYP